MTLASNKQTNSTEKPSGQKSKGDKKSIKNSSKKKETKEDLKSVDINMYYDIGPALGEGTFSVVKLSKHLISEENVAIKILQKSRIKNKED